MELKFSGTLAEIKSEMQDFLGSEEPEAGKTGTGKTGGGRAKPEKKVEKITLDVIREAMLACEDKDGKKNLLADYGASKLSELPEEKYEEFHADLKKL